MRGWEVARGRDLPPSQRPSDLDRDAMLGYVLVDLHRVSAIPETAALRRHACIVAERRTRWPRGAGLGEEALERRRHDLQPRVGSQPPRPGARRSSPTGPPHWLVNPSESPGVADHVALVLGSQAPRT